MAQYTIYFESVAGTTVNVEADDFESALDLAYDRLPSGVCAQCAGWGRDDKPGIDLSGEWEPDYKSYEVDGERVTA